MDDEKLTSVPTSDESSQDQLNTETSAKTVSDVEKQKKKNRKQANIVTGIAMVLAVCLVLSSLYFVGKRLGQKTALADSYQNHVADDVATSTADAITQGVVNNILDSGLTKFLDEDSLKEIISNSMGDYLTEDEQSSVAKELRNTIYTAVANQSGALTSNEISQIQTITKNIVSDQLGASDFYDAAYNYDDIVKVIANNISSNDDLYKILANIKTNSNQVEFSQAFNSSNIKDIISKYLSTNNYSGPQRDEIIQKITSSVTNNLTSQLKEVVRTVGTVGKDGVNGSSSSSDGANGTNGKDGINGSSSSSDGANGTNGSNGINGTNGTDGYIPIKGVDYFTESEIQQIIRTASDQAKVNVNDALKQLQSNVQTLQAQITNVNSSVSAVQLQLDNYADELDNIKNSSGSSDPSGSDGTNGSDGKDAEIPQEIYDSIAELQSALQETNDSIADIADKFTLKKITLRIFKQKSGSIFQAETIDTSNMSVSDILDVITKNQQTYTEAINQLWYHTKQLESYLGVDFPDLSGDLAGLNGQLDAANGNITNLYDEMAALKQQIANQKSDASDELNKKYSDLQDTLDAYKEALKNGNPDEIAAAKKKLEDAIAEYKKFIEDNKSSFDPATQNEVKNIYQYIENIQNAIDNSSLSSEEIINIIESNQTKMDESQKAINANLQKQIDDLSNEIADLRKGLFEIASGGQTSGIEAEIKDLQTIISNINSYNSTINNLLQQLQDAIASGDEERATELRNQLTQVYNEYKSYLSANYDSADPDTQKKFDNLIQNIDNILNILGDTSIPMDELMEKLMPKIEDAMGISQSIVNALTSRVQDLEDKINSIELRVSAALTLAQSMKGELSSESYDRQVADQALKSYMEASIADLIQKNQQLQDMVTSGSSGSGSTGSYTGDVAELRREMIDSINELHDELQSVSGSLQEELADYIDEINASITDLQDILDNDVTKSIDDINVAMNDLSAAVNSMNTSLQGKINSIEEALRANMAEETQNRIAADEELQQAIAESQQGISEALQALNEAISLGDQNVIERTQQSLENAIDSLENRIGSMSDRFDTIISNQIEAVTNNINATKKLLEDDITENIAKVNKTISDLNTTLTNVDKGLQNQVDELVEEDKRLHSELTAETDTRYKMMLDINYNNSKADTWCYNVTLKKDAGGSSYQSNSKSTVYPVIENGDIVWTIYTTTGLNIQAGSDIQIFYTNETQDDVTNNGTVIQYTLNDGSIQIKVPKGYSKTLKKDLNISVIHCTCPIMKLHTVDEEELSGSTNP